MKERFKEPAIENKLMTNSLKASKIPILKPVSEQARRLIPQKKTDSCWFSTYTGWWTPTHRRHGERCKCRRKTYRKCI